MKRYNKYYLKKDPASGNVLVEDGKPVLGELAKSDCPLEERHVTALNRSWKKTGIFFAPMQEEAKPSSGGDNGLDALTKNELIDKCVELKLDTNGNKAELIERITNHKPE